MATPAVRHEAQLFSSRRVVQPALPILPRKPNANSSQSATPARVPTPTPQHYDVPSSRASQLDEVADSHEAAAISLPQELVNGNIDRGTKEPVVASESHYVFREDANALYAGSREDSKEVTYGPEFSAQEEGGLQTSRHDPDGAEDEARVELPADRPAHTEPTKENVQNLESQPYEPNKVQEWAEEVNDGSNQSTWSNGKEIQVNPRVNGIASSSSQEEMPPPVASESVRQSSQSSAPEVATVNGTVEDVSKAVEEPVQTQEATTEPPIEQTALPTISEHLLQLATTKIWADWAIMVNAPGQQPLVTYAHSLVLVRSTRLEAEMRRAGSTGVINLHPPREILPHALEAALRFLYSDNIVSEDYPFPQDVNAREARTNALNYILSYWVAAIEFGLAPVATRALQLLDGFIGWDVAELIVKNAEELKLAVTQMGEEYASSSDDYLGVVARTKKIVLRFLSAYVNPDTFKIETVPSPSMLRSRFALLEESRLKHNPALASMVFGSMPSSTDLSPSSPQSEILPAVSSMEDRVASNILLNLDFSDLEYFCAHFQQAKGAVGAAQSIAGIVAEREHRRIKIINNRAIPNKQRIANSAVWNEAGFQESFEDGCLRRERVGFLLPTKAK